MVFKSFYSNNQKLIVNYFNESLSASWFKFLLLPTVLASIQKLKKSIKKYLSINPNFDTYGNLIYFNSRCSKLLTLLNIGYTL